jgi:glucokinase
MDDSRSGSPVLAIDIGGTKIAAALIEPSGQVLGRARGETPDTVDAMDVVAAVARVAGMAASQAGRPLKDIHVAGVSCAGIPNTIEGVMVFSPNIRALRRTPLRDMLAERLDCTIHLGNDASLAALGEWHFGLKRSVSNLVYVTVSTGIGGGIIADGKLVGGACGAAGEVGHMTIDVNGPACPCGRNGCWEALAAGRALAERTVQRIEEGEPSIIGDLAGGDMENVDAQLVDIAARQGDALALEMISVTAYYVGVGLGNLINLFNPEIILLGGGVTKIGEPLVGPAARIARERAYVTEACDVEIRRATLGDDSPLLGATALALGLDR